MKAADQGMNMFVMRRLIDHKTTFDQGDIRDLIDLHLDKRKWWQDEKMKSGKMWLLALGVTVILVLILFLLLL